MATFFTSCKLLKRLIKEFRKAIVNNVEWITIVHKEISQKIYFLLKNKSFR